MGRILKIIFTAIFLLISIACIAYFNRADYLANDFHLNYLIAELSGVIAITTGIIALPEKFRPSHKTRKQKPYLANNHIFVDRTNETATLLYFLKEETNIIVHGQNGIGKTLLLKKFADIINGFKHVKEYKYKSNIISIYFDFSSVINKNGILEIMNIYTKCFFNISIFTYSEFFDLLNRGKKKKIVLIYDNVRNIGVFNELGRTISSCQHKECLFVFGANECFSSCEFNAKELNMNGRYFKSMEIKEIAELTNCELSSELADRILEESQGIPVFINFLMKNGGTNIGNANKGIAYYMKEVFDELDYEIQGVLVTVTALSLTQKCHSFNELHSIDMNISHVSLKQLATFSLLNYDNASETVSMHDSIVRIIAEEVSETRIIDKHKQCAERMIELGKKLANTSYRGRAILHYLRSSEINEHIQLIKEMLEKAQIKDNYSFLLECYNSFTDNKQLVSKDLRDCLMYSYIYALMGIGEYLKAKEFIGKINFTESFNPLQRIETEFDMAFHFLIADLEHLLNNFAIAQEQMYFLLSISKEKGFNKYIVKCTWAIAHIESHIGVDLRKAKQLYIEAKNLAKLEDDNVHYVKSIYGVICINLTMNVRDYDYEAGFAEIVAIGERTNKLQHLVYRAFRHKANYLRMIGRLEESEALLKQLVEYFISSRIKYDIYFALAELYRETLQIAESQHYYNLTIEFAKKANDLNLQTNAMLGLALLQKEIGTDDSNTISQILEVIKICEQYNLVINKVHANIVLSSLKSEPLSESELLLILRLKLNYEHKLLKNNVLSNVTKLRLIVR